MNLTEPPLTRSISLPLTANHLHRTYSPKTYGEMDQATTLSRIGTAIAGRVVSSGKATEADFEAVHSISLSTRIAAPTGTAFEKWCQFNDLPHFMRTPGLVEAQESHMVWRLRAWNDSAPWLAATDEVVPAHRITWKGLPGVLQANRGKVTFEPMDSEGAETRVTVTLELGNISAGNRWLEAMATLVECTLASFSRSVHSPASAVPLAA